MGAAQIVATEPLAHRRAAARSVGADEVWAVDEAGFSREAAAHPVDVAIEAAGADGAAETAMAAVGLGGRVVLAGIPSPDRTTFTASTARRKGLTLVLSRRMRSHHLARAAALAGSGLVPLAPVISARFPLADAVRAFEGLVRRDGLKVIVEPSA
jgi:L-iditol 2-dehydrogenase